MPMGIDKYTKLMIHMNGADTSTTFTDSSDSAHTLTARGNAQIDTAQSKFSGSSAIFDGTGDYIEAPDSDDFHLSTNDFTIDFWYRPGTGNACYPFAQQVDVGNTINFVVTQTVALMTVTIASVAEVSLNWIYSALAADTWHHYAIVRDGSSLRLFLNGTEETPANTLTYDIPNLATEVSVGGIIGGAVTTGHMDEFRFTNGKARWTADFTPPNEEYYAFSGGGSQDNTETASVITVSAVDGPTTVTTSRLPVGAFYWDAGNAGSGRSVQIDDKNGNMIWKATTQDAETMFSRTFEMNSMVNGVDVTTIDDGTLYIYTR